MLSKKKESKLKIKGTPVFERNYNALFYNPEKRFLINVGGTRSSKTYSILQLLVLYAFAKPNSRIGIYRKYKSALTASVLPDLLQILGELQIFKQVEFNKSIGSFRFPGGSTINLYGTDDEAQLRGRKYDLVFINEATEVSYEEYLQINLRTKDKIIFDYNPSNPFHWVYERLLKEANALLIHSTYLDNPFLPEVQVKEIQNLILIDENYYNIYTLGILPVGKEFIFPTLYSTPFPEDIQYTMGLDYGYTDPNVLVKVAVEDGKCYIKQEIHQSRLNSEELIEEMNFIQISKSDFILADSSRPEMINSIYNAGFLIEAAKKGPNSIIEGLDYLRTLEIHIDPSSTQTWNEFRNYKYKTLNGRVTEIPQPFNDHSIDAVRYAVSQIRLGTSTTSFYNN